MLSEGFMILQALRAANIPLSADNPRIKDVVPSGGPCLRVGLGHGGIVSGVKEVTAEEFANLWIIIRTSDGSFPVVRINKPLYVVDANLLKEISAAKAHARIARLGQIAEKCVFRQQDGNTRPWADARAKATELRAGLELQKYETDRILLEFVERFLEATNDPQRLLKTIDQKCIDGFSNSRCSEKLVLALRVGRLNRGRVATKVQLAFDIDSGKTIYQAKIRAFAGKYLPAQTKSDAKGKAASPDRCCAFSGARTQLQNSAFPPVPLPIIGKMGVSLVSMFSDAPCNTRYGLTASAIIPVGESVATDVFNALKEITATMRKGKTWRGIARGEYEKTGRKKFEKQDLLIVYVDGMPDIPVEVGNMFGTDQDSVVKQFEADAGTVCNALKGIARQRPESKLNLIVIRDVSKGQAQLVISESFSVERFFKAIEQWQRAVKGNLPPIEVLLPPSQRGEKGIIASPPVPYPDEIVKILSRKYISLGLDARDVRGVSFGEVLDFMLRKEGRWKDTCQKMLDLALQDYEPLLVGLFGAKHSCDQERFQKYSSGSRKDALRAISLLGLLLDANNRSKESYMKDAAFKIGGFLALADILHKDYCVVVRNNSLPPSLIGNAMMPRAFDNPLLAVEDLADRMRVYTGWAKTARVPDDNEERKIAVLEAKKTLIRYEPLAKNLHDIGLPEQCSGTMKAEILLGYLASTKGLESEAN